MGKAVGIHALHGSHLGVCAGRGFHDVHLPNMRGLSECLCELRRELPKHRMTAVVAHEPEPGDIPKGRGAAVTQQHLVAIGKAEQVGQPASHPAHHRFDGGLPVRRAHK